MRAQISMEYLMVTGFVAITVLAFFSVAYYRAEQAQDSIDQAQLDKIGRAFINNAERVYYQGKPARAFVEDRFPENIQEVRTVSEGGNYVLQFIPTPNTGLSEVSYPSDVPIDIVISNAEELGAGRYRWQLTALGDKVSLVYSNPYEMWYRFDDFERQFIRDYSGNGVTGVYDIGAEGWYDGIMGNGGCTPGTESCPTRIRRGNSQALQFDRDDYVMFEAEDGFDDLFIGGFTITFHIKIDDVDNLPATGGSAGTMKDTMFVYHKGRLSASGSTDFGIGVVDKNGGTNKGKLILWDTSSYYGVTQPYRSSIAIDDNNWHHVALVYDATGAQNKLSFYIDGVERGSYGSSSDMVLYVDSETPIVGGATDAFTHSLIGSLDEVRTYDIPLSSDQVSLDRQSRYPLPIGKARPGPLFSHSFEELSYDPPIRVLDTHNLVQGSKGGAISFDGVDDELMVTRLMPLGEEFTLGLGYSTSNQPNQYPRFIDARSTVSLSSIRAWPRSGASGVSGRLLDNNGCPIPNCDFIYHTESNDDGQWHSLRTVADDGTISVYHDSTLQEPPPSPPNPLTAEFTLDTLYFGNDGLTPDAPYRGLMDEIYISTNVITP